MILYGSPWNNCVGMDRKDNWILFYREKDTCIVFLQPYMKRQIYPPTRELEDLISDSLLVGWTLISLYL